MKKNMIFLILVCLVSLLILGVNAEGETEEEEVPLELIKEYVQVKEHTQRWPSYKNVVVLDETGRTKRFWKKINGIIEDTDAGIFFEYKTNKEISPEEADIWISHDRGLEENTFRYRISVLENSVFTRAEIKLHPKLHKECSVEFVLLTIGIHENKISEGLTKQMKKVIYWLYQLEPGTLL